MVEAEGVGLILQGATVLDRIDLRVEEGSFLGVIGPNGAGKSSLLRVLTGLVRPTYGRVLLEGVALQRYSARERARRVALVSQNPHSGFGFTVEEVVSMGRYAHRGRFEPPGRRDLEAVWEAMRATGVAGLADRPVTQLSGGERQRAFVARALAQEPRALFLDEPTSNLDIRYQLEILALIAGLNREKGLTVVMAIHDLAWAARYCSHILALKEGRQVAHGPAGQVLTEELIERLYGVRGRVRVGPGGAPVGVEYVEAVGSAGAVEREGRDEAPAARR